MTDGASPVFFCTKSLVISLVNSGWARLCLNHFEPGPISCEVKTAHKPGKNHGERTFRVQSFKAIKYFINQFRMQQIRFFFLIYSNDILEQYCRWLYNTLNPSIPLSAVIKIINMVLHSRMSFIKDNDCYSLRDQFVKVAGEQIRVLQ